MTNTDRLETNSRELTLRNLKTPDVAEALTETDAVAPTPDQVELCKALNTAMEHQDAEAIGKAVLAICEHYNRHEIDERTQTWITDGEAA